MKTVQWITEDCDNDSISSSTCQEWFVKFKKRFSAQRQRTVQKNPKYENWWIQRTFEDNKKEYNNHYELDKKLEMNLSTHLNDSLK